MRYDLKKPFSAIAEMRESKVWLPEPEIYRTWFFSKIFMGYVRPSKQKRQKCKPKRARPRLTRTERERQFREILDAEPELTRADLAHRIGVSRAWVTKVLGALP